MEAPRRRRRQRAPSTAPSQAASVAPSTEASAPAASAATAPIKIGSDNFYESKLVAEIYAQVLENAGYTVERKFGLGSRQERIPTMDAGQVDLVPEYVGSGLGFYDTTKTTGDGTANATALQAALDAASKNITVLAISPGQDTERVRGPGRGRHEQEPDQDRRPRRDPGHAQVGPPGRLRHQPAVRGCAEERTASTTRRSSARRSVRADVPMATALQGKAIDVAEFCSTQPAIAQFGFKVLDDDKKTQPAENLAPLVRNDYLAKVDKTAFEALLNAASAKITTDLLTTMGVAVAVDQKDVAEVAKGFLQQQGLIP